MKKPTTESPQKHVAKCVVLILLDMFDATKQDSISLKEQQQ